MHPKIMGSASGSGRRLDISYLAVLTIENADASQNCADSVPVISCRYSDERNLQLDDIPIFNQLRFDNSESAACQSRVVYGLPSHSRSFSIRTLFSLKVVNFIFFGVHEQRACCLAERAEGVYIDSNGTNILRACYSFRGEVSICNVNGRAFFKHGVYAFFGETVAHPPSEDGVYNCDICNEAVIN